MDRLPDTDGMPNEIVIPRSHRNGYDHACLASGRARLVEVGVAERTRDPQSWEIAAAVNERTVAIAFSVGFSPLPLADVVVVAREHGVPVIVDASAALPPRGNLRKFVAAGADLVAFSGGKAIRGPQASGILCGRKDLIASAGLQMWDMDFVPALWNPPPSLIDPAIAKRGIPNHGLGRAMKVGKEEIAGLLVALERFAAGDDAADLAATGRPFLQQIAKALWPTRARRQYNFVERQELMAIGALPKSRPNFCQEPNRDRCSAQAGKRFAADLPRHGRRGRWSPGHRSVLLATGRSRSGRRPRACGFRDLTTRSRRKLERLAR